MTAKTFETIDDLVDDDISGGPYAVLDSKGIAWMAWASEDGWYVIRPRNEDDPKGPGEDIARPQGPCDAESMAFPVAAIDIHPALADAVGA